jgi:hypothetical protein
MDNECLKRILKRNERILGLTTKRLISKGSEAV